MIPGKPLPRKKCPACGTWISAFWQVIGGVRMPVMPHTCPQCHRGLHGRGRYHARDQRAIDRMSKESRDKEAN